jgi:NAD(P)-dependent dehydrogenase (short-subunit alcohol dehydrogenase family)
MRTVNLRFMTHPQPVYEVSPDGSRDVVETKVTGTLLVARAVVPWMLAAGSGRVVNQRIIATTFSDWLSAYKADSRGAS